MREEKFLSSKLPRLAFLNQFIIRTSGNYLFCVLKLQGASIVTESAERINELDAAWHNVVKSLDSDFALYAHVFRTKSPASFEIKSQSQFTENFNRKYQQKYLAAELYCNDLYLTLIYNGLSYSGHKVLSLLNRKYQESLNYRFSDGAEILTKKANELLALLSPFSPSLLDLERTEFSQVMSFLGRFCNGLQEYKQAYPMEDMNGYLQNALSPWGNLYLPASNLVEFISNHEIIFADTRYLMFRDQAGKETYACMLSIKNYASSANPLTFDRLLHAEMDLLLTVSFRPMQKNQSSYKVGRALYKHQAGGDEAVSQHEELLGLKDDLASDRVTLGMFHSSVMVLADSVKNLELKAAEILKIFNNQGFQAVMEGRNTWSSFFAQFPTNFKAINRGRLVTSSLFAHFFAMHNYPSGHTNKTHLGEGLCLLDTPFHTPMWFNYAAKASGEKNDYAASHTYMVGSTRAGKTVLLLAFDALMEKYDNRSFFFDYEGGAYNYFKATGNSYFDYNLNNQSINHNPFSLPDTVSNRSFLIDFLCALVGGEITPEIKEHLTYAVEYGFSLPVSQRSLSKILDNSLNKDFPKWGNLKPFLRGNKNREDGLYCNFFDNEDELLQFAGYKVAFDMSKLMGEKEVNLKTALLKYLFHLIELNREQHSAPISIILDEGWAYLDDPSWIPWFNSRIPTLAKRNIAFIIATQAAETVLNSPVAPQIITNSATAIFMPNSKADFKVYKTFDITPDEFDFIKKTSKESRYFLYKQDQTSAICKLNLEGFAKELSILSTNSSSRKFLDTLILQYGTDPSNWLPHFYHES